MNLLWTAEELVSAMQARPVGRLPEGATGISIDTRSIQQGEAFFAIRGENFDGHDFVTNAMRAGAALAVVAEEKLVALGHLRLPLLVVSNVLTALEMLGRAARARSNARIVAVTGSVGKTSTKEMLRAALSSCGKTHASASSFNNHWGVPLTLARMPADARFGVFEIGMNHPGEITPLVGQVRPHVAVITRVAAAHHGAFSDVDEIARAKAEIFSGVEPSGAAVLNRDDRRFGLLSEMATQAGINNIYSFGSKKGADFRLKSVRSLADCSVVEATIGEEPVTYKIGAPGSHFVANSLAALGAATLAGGDLAKCALAMAEVHAGKGRGQRHNLKVRGGGFTLIDESYNANPASVEAAISLLAASEPAGRGRRIVVLGDMLELGKASARLHRSLKKQIEASGIDVVYLVGKEMEALAKALDPALLGGHFPTAADIEKPLLATPRAGDVLMVKASLGLKFPRLVETMLKAFPEIDTVTG